MNNINPYVIVGIPRHTKSYTVQDVLRLVSSKYNVTIERISKKNRHREIVFIRQMIWTLVRPICTLDQCAQLFNNNFDHTTVIYSVKTMKDIIDTDAKVKADYDYFVNKLRIIPFNEMFGIKNEME